MWQLDRDKQRRFMERRSKLRLYGNGRRTNDDTQI
jgi:hypothetical protein